MLPGLLAERGTKKWLERNPVAKWRAKIRLTIAEQAGAEFPVRGEAHAVAAATVGVSHRSYEADASGSGAKPEIARGTIAPRRSIRFLERRDCLEAPENLRTRDDVIPGQIAELSNRHELDEPHVPGVINGEPGKIGQLIVIDPTHDDDVDLDRRQPRGFRGSSGSDRIEIETAPRDSFDAIRSQGVHAHVHAVEAGRLEPGGELHETHSIGGERNVLDPGYCTEHRNEAIQIGANRGLTTGYPQASETEWGELLHDAGDLFIGEDVGLGKPFQPGDRHAIETAEVAFVGDGDPEILDRPAGAVL